MNLPVSLFIALRYMHGHKTDRFSRFVSRLSVIGISLGVMAMITVLSVMNGFERELQKNLLDVMPQAVVTSAKGSINPDHFPASLLKLQGVIQIKPLSTGDVVLQSYRTIATGIMLGVQPDEADPLTPYIEGTKQTELIAGDYSIILGRQLADLLGVKRGDNIRVMVPSSSQFTPMGRVPSQRIFTVIGFFNVPGNSEVNQYQLLVNQQDASRLMRYPPGNITGWRLFLTEPLKIDILAQQMFPPGSVLKDWRERKGELFQTVGLEKRMMGLLLSLIVIVAIFNILTTLGLQVMEKQGEVAILQTQGLSPHQIMAVFMIQGAGLGIIGALSGTLLGVLVSSQLNNLLPLLNFLVKEAAFPVKIDPLQVVIIALSVTGTALLSALYPAWQAIATQPAEALRYE